MNKRIGKVIEKSRIGRNTAPKIISLIFAIVFWVYVMDQVNPEIIKEYDDIRVEIVGAEQISTEGLILMNNEEHLVTVTVEGRRNDLLNFDENYLLITADVRGYKKGLNNVPIEKRVLVDNVVISDISKSDIKIQLDQIISIPKPIDIVANGTAVSGYELGPIEKDKMDIVVSGPETLVNRVVNLHGELNISEIQNDFTTEISIVPVDYEGNQVSGVELLQTSVQCFIGVQKLRTLSIVANFTGQVQEGYQLIDIPLNPTSVVVRGKPEVVNNMNNVLTSKIELSEITERYRTELGLILPEGVDTPFMDKPVQAEVIVEKIETKEFIFDLNEIGFANLNDIYSIKVLNSPGTLDVSLKDISSKLDLVNRNDIQLEIDLEGLDEGIHELPIDIITESKIKEISLNRETINIEIQLKEE